MRVTSLLFKQDISGSNPDRTKVQQLRLTATSLLMKPAEAAHPLDPNFPAVPNRVTSDLYSEPAGIISRSLFLVHHPLGAISLRCVCLLRPAGRKSRSYRGALFLASAYPPGKPKCRLRRLVLTHPAPGSKNQSSVRLSIRLISERPLVQIQLVLSESVDVESWFHSLSSPVPPISRTHRIDLKAG